MSALRGRQIMAKLAERGIALELVRHEDGDERIIARPTLAISEALRAWLKENRKSLLEALRDADAIRSEQEVFDLGRERFGLREDGPPHPERDLGRAAHLGLIAKWSRSISPFRRKGDQDLRSKRRGSVPGGRKAQGVPRVLRWVRVDRGRGGRPGLRGSRAMQAVLIMSTADLDKRILTLLLDALRGCELTATNLEAMAALVRATLRDVPLEFPDWINTKGER